MAALDVGGWLRTTRGRIVLLGFVLLLVVLVGLALAGFYFAAELLFSLMGFAAGSAAGYFASGMLRRRVGANRGRVPRLFAVWGAYVLATALVFGVALFFDLTGQRAGSSAGIAIGLTQGFGTTFWPLLLAPSLKAQEANPGVQGWMLKALGLHVGGTAAGGLLVGIFLVVYVFGLPNR